VIAPTWPFIGREREVEAAVEELSGPGSAGVLLVGEAGVGKTRLLDQVAAELQRRGRSTNRAVGSTATQSIPYAAIAHLMPRHTIADGLPDPISLFVEVERLIRSAVPEGERFVMTVDDVGLLDPASLTLCNQLVNSGAAALLATTRSTDPVPPAIASLERTQQVLRVEVGTFDVEGVVTLLEEVLGGTVDRRTGQALWDATRGNLLYLRELVHGARQSGALTSERGHWHLVAPLTATSRLAEIVSDRLAGLPPTARELAEVLALAEPLRIDDLETAGLGEAALLLDGAGLVTSSDEGGTTLVRLGHPLYGEVLRAQLSPLRRRTLLLRAAGAVSAAGRTDDALRLATWLTSAGATVDPGILREGALRARAANDLALTEVLARAAADRAPDLDVLLALGDALHEFGKVDEAERVLDAAAAYARTDDDRLRLAILHHRVRLWGACDAAGSVAVLRAAEAEMAPGLARTMVRIAVTNTVVFHDDPASALTVLDPAELDHPVAAALASHARSIALTRLGDPVAGADVAATARAGGDADHPALLMNAEALARVEAGDLDGAATVAADGYRIVTGQQLPQMQAWIAFTCGRVALFRGRPTSARRWFAEGLALSVESHFRTGRRIGIGALAACAGLLGDVHGSATLLAELDELDDDIEFFAAELAMGRAWALVALGRISEAVDAVCAGAARAETSGDATLRLELLYDATRIGGPGTVRDVATGPTVTGPLAAARRAYVIGINEGSPTALAEAEAGFALIGADLAAAEAGAALAAELTRARRPREAAAASVRSAAHQRSTEGATTPALVQRATPTALTRREREIGLLAVRGLASKAIARELGVSERTVSNHLQNAYVKLGISTRADLAEALGVVEGAPG